MIYAVPEGPILESLLLVVDKYSVFLVKVPCVMPNYAHGDTPYTNNKNEFYNSDK